MTLFVSRPAAERFWDLVNGPWYDPRVGGEDCWLWMGAKGQSRRPKGLPAMKPWKQYGRFSMSHGDTVGAHRAALILTGNPPPNDAAVASHTVCDQPLCCNPIHLKWDTPQGNIAEALAKGRLIRIPTARGVRYAAPA